RGRDIRHGPVSASLGQQRNVVAQPLVAVVAAKVEDLGALELAVSRVGQVLLGGDDLDTRNVQRPLGRVVDDDQRTHAAGAPGSMSSRLASNVTVPSRIEAIKRSTLTL